MRLQVDEFASLIAAALHTCSMVECGFIVLCGDATAFEYLAFLLHAEHTIGKESGSLPFQSLARSGRIDGE